MMRLDDFDFTLPEDLIASTPVSVRDRSKLLVLNRNSGKTNHHTFYELSDFLRAGDILVLNDSKVFPARLVGRKPSGGQAEILLNREIGPFLWEAVGKRLKKGDIISYPGSSLSAKIVNKENELLNVSVNLAGNDFFREIGKIGQVPLPPYIISKRKKSAKQDYDDKNSYQTVYAQNTGSVAAPTAGLHFTKELLEELEKKGVVILKLSLHVGLGTFAPVKAESIAKRSLHYEHYSIESAAYQEIIQAKAQKRRIIAVGTTTTRVLEHLFASPPDLTALPPIILGQTDIFIYPPYRFRAIDGLITNFHLPKSSLLMLVSAFAGRENILQAYKEAISHHYRFYSYGDAMFIC